MGQQRTDRSRLPTPLVCAVGGLATVLASCASTPETFPQPLDPTAYDTLTNALTSLGTAVGHSAPGPIGPIVEGLTGLAVVALAGWQLATHRKITLLLNGDEPPSKKDPPK